MKHKFIFGFFLILCLLLSATYSRAQQQTNPRAAWFVDARYGMFIHWGVYSGAEGLWKGEKLRYDNDYAEWIYYRNRIDREEYLGLLKEFDWDSIDPEDWVVLAKKAGMKYVTLTAKHHDGFALWDSQVGNYDIGEYAEGRRDIVKELAVACKKHGLKMGLYYSHWVDWEHPYGWDHTKEIYPIKPEQYDHYWQEKVMPQMEELLSNYGEIGLIWFDMWIHHSRTIVTQEQLHQLKAKIRELQPNCLVNSRLGLSVEEDPDVDFRTLGDNSFGTMKLDYPWQSPATVAHSWGYHALENEWKSSTTLLKSLVGNVSLNGNMMLNIGPRANGEVPFEIEQRLLQIGDWLSRNGESIYGAGGFDLDKDQHDWCTITTRQEGNTTKVYLHLYNWPLDKKVKLTGIHSSPQRMYALADPERNPLLFKQEGPVTQLLLPGKQPDPLLSVLVLEYAGKPEIENGLVAESMSNGYSLTPQNWTEAEGSSMLEGPQRFGSVPAHIVVNEASRYAWRLYFDEPGSYQVDISYSCSQPADGSMAFKANKRELVHEFMSTGMTVGEPRNDWHIDSYESHHLGVIEIKKPGYQIVSLAVNPPTDGDVHFQWLWMAKGD